MDIFLNFGFAWISMGLTLILAVVYMTRKQIAFTHNKHLWIKVNKSLRTYHKELGLLLILTGFYHGYNSSFNVLTLNWGTAAWVLSILLGLNWLFKAQLTQLKHWMLIHRWLTVVFILSIGLHLYEVGGIQIFDLGTYSQRSTLTLSENLKIDAATLQEGIVYGSFEDGTYTGSATGYGNNLTVEVVIEANMLTSIQIVSHQERQSSFYQKAFDQIPVSILETQSLDVDTISGATYSSVGIINAVNDALSQALVSGSLPNDLSLPTRKRH